MVKSLLGFCSRVLAARRFESATKSCEWSRKQLSKSPPCSPTLLGAQLKTTPPHRKFAILSLLHTDIDAFDDVFLLDFFHDIHAAGRLAEHSVAAV